MKELREKYGKDVVDLVLSIEEKLRVYLKNRKFGGKYADNAEFRMIPSSNVGAFYVTFPQSKSIALAAIDLASGDYQFKSDKTLKIYKLDGLDMPKLVDRAESDWALAPQPMRDPGSIVDFSFKV